MIVQIIWAKFLKLYDFILNIVFFMLKLICVLNIFEIVFLFVI